MCTTATSGHDLRCPGTQALTLIGDQLADKGYEVSSPEWCGTHLLKVMNAPLALCEMTISDDAAQWYYQPFRGHQGALPDAVAMATAIIGVADRAHGVGSSARLPARPCHPQFAGIINGLVGSGLLVTCSDVSGDGDVVELALDNPARPDRGTVRITGDHAIIWDYRPGSFRGIADTITRALAAARQ